LFVFVLLTWTADPLFNLLLHMNRFGRLALSREQIRASNWVGGCLLLALVALLAWAVSGDARFSLLALVCGWLVLPVAATFKSPAGRPRLLMALYTILLALVGGSGVGIFFSGGYLPRYLWQDALAAARLLLGMFFLGAVASTWLFNLLFLARTRR
jgi:hypothetical protein